MEVRHKSKSQYRLATVDSRNKVWKTAVFDRAAPTGLFFAWTVELGIVGLS
jgi:hypothetical protein